MFDKIPKMRLLIYAMILGIIPVVISLMHVWQQSNTIDQLQEMIVDVEAMASSYKQRQSVNMAVIEHYRDADHFYIDKYMETLNFLEPEIEALQKIVNHKNFPGDPSIKKRYDFLTGPGNSMAFTEGVVQSYPLYQETTETLTHPIEVNVEDIKKILARIEGVEVGGYRPGPNKPQLIVLDFKMDKKAQQSGNETYNLNLKLLKREYL
jgi:hypothetical protein